MRKSPLAIAGGIVLTIFYALALFAPFVAPYTQEEMDRAKYFHPPQPLHWVRADGSFSLRPYVRDMRVVDMGSFEYEEDPSKELAGAVFRARGALRAGRVDSVEHPSVRRRSAGPRVACSAAIRSGAMSCRVCCTARVSR